MFCRQAQNLRDELYQAKLRLEKETSSLKETNKVLCLNLSYSQPLLIRAISQFLILWKALRVVLVLVLLDCTVGCQNDRKSSQSLRR